LAAGRRRRTLGHALADVLEADAVHEERGEPLQPTRVTVVEATNARAIEIQYAQQLAARDQWNNNLRLRSGITRDVAGKRVNVRHNDGPSLECSGAADPFSQRDTHARRLPLEGSYDQLAILQEVKPSPVEIGQASKISAVVFAALATKSLSPLSSPASSSARWA